MLYYLFFFLFFSCTHQQNRWALIENPSIENPEAIGTYSAGCVKGAQALVTDKKFIHLARPSRKRFYGHPDLIQFLDTYSHQIYNQGLGVLLVSDMSQPRGGPMINSHSSHQIGLEADIWYYRLPSTDLNNQIPIENINALSFEKENINEVIKILKIAASHTNVDRIFVDPPIKKILCEKYKGKKWIIKIRPWWKHHDHFHVRLKCPKDSFLCHQMVEVQSENCDETLDWWFSQEGLAYKNSSSTKPTVEKPLPPECATLLK